jgi:hypothetical protein
MFFYREQDELKKRMVLEDSEDLKCMAGSCDSGQSIIFNSTMLILFKELLIKEILI